MGQEHELPPGVCPVNDRCPVGQADTPPFPATESVAGGSVWVRVFSAGYLRFWTYVLFVVGIVGGGTAILAFWLYRRVQTLKEAAVAVCDSIAIARGMFLESLGRRIRGD